MMPTVDQASALLNRGLITPETFEAIKARNIDDNLVAATIGPESGGDPNAVSPKGAEGLMQVMPATGAEVAQKLGIQNPDLKDPATNQVIGATYLQDQVDHFHDPQLASAAYNAGPGRVQQTIDSVGSNDPALVLPALPGETQHYVPQVASGYGANANKNAAPVDPAAAADTAAQIDAGYGLQSQGVAEAAAVGMKQATEEAAYQKTMLTERERLANEFAEHEAARKEQLDKQMQRADTAINDYAGQKVESFWSKASTGSKVLAALSVALSGIGQGLQASSGINAPNQALAVLKSVIDDDIETQKANIAIKGNAAQNQRGLLSDMRERFGNERQAELMAQTIAWNNAQIKLQEIASQYKAPALQANAKVLSGQIEEEKGKLLAQFQQNAASLPSAQAAFGYNQRQQVLAGKAPVGSLPKDDRERFVPGLGFARDGEEAKKVTQAQTDYQDITNLIDQTVDDRKKYGAEVLNRDVIAKQQSRSTQILLKLKNLAQLGVLSNRDQELLEGMIPKDPTEFNAERVLPDFMVGKDPVLSKLGELQNQLNSQFKNGIRSRIQEGTPAALNVTTKLDVGAPVKK